MAREQGIPPSQINWKTVRGDFSEVSRPTSTQFISDMETRMDPELFQSTMEAPMGLTDEFGNQLKTITDFSDNTIQELIETGDVFEYKDPFAYRSMPVMKQEKTPKLWQWLDYLYGNPEDENQPMKLSRWED